MAARLAEKLSEVPGLSLAFPPQANAVFINMPRDVAERLARQGWHLYDFIGGAYRCMCAWDTTVEDIDAFMLDISNAAAARE
jgi:threonine aldolase